ncbi:hypothetical protein DRQ33_04245 [bacterium]|nr:MAG: hypothetical protein DRQ33_04245 [bacterium]
MNRLNKVLLFILIFSAVEFIWGQVYLPNTKLTISSPNIALKGVLDDWWYTESVICSTETGCVDVIFVVDTSGSMSDKIGELYTEIGEFAYNIESQGYEGSFGIVTFVDSPNFPAGDTLFTDADDFSDFMADLTGAEGGFEAPIDASFEAIDRYSVNWNDTCDHVLIVLTDETEEDSDTYTLSDLISYAQAESTSIYLVSPSGHPMEPACTSTGGQWFEIGSVSMDEVLEAVADDIAEYTAITIILDNTSGTDLSDVQVELNPFSCIEMDIPADSIQNTGPLAAGESDTITWQITEVPNCHGCDDCFWIDVTADTMTDSIQGCLFVENCDCPGINANVIQPRHCGRYTACDEVVFQFEGCLPVDVNSIVVYMDGEYISYPDPRLSYNPSNQTLTYTATPPFSDGAYIEFYISEATDISGCELRYSQHCSVIIDKSPPAFDDGPNWSPACETTIDDATVIHFDACVHDEGAGMTPMDASGELSEDALFSIFYAVYLEINGGIFGGDSLFEIPGIPGLPGLGYHLLWRETHPEGFPPSCVCGTIADSSLIFYDGFPLTNFHIIREQCRIDAIWPCTEDYCPPCSDCDWQVQFDILAGDIRSLVGDPVELELCFHFQDLVEEVDCGPNDTVVCCTYYFTDCVPVTPFNLISPSNGFSADCSLNVVLQWEVPSGSTPITYDLYFDGALEANDLSTNSYDMGIMSNYSDTVVSHSWYVIATNPCGEETTAVWTFDIQPCCAPAITHLGCPYPDCFAFTSCEPQNVDFIVYDTTGQTIDHSRTYFTLYIYHYDGTADTIYITGDSGDVSWSGDTASIIWTPTDDGDSVVIVLDSVYTEEGCFTIPTP